MTVVPFSLEYNPEKKGFFVLATNSLNQSILFEVDNYFQNIVILDTLEGTPMGVTLDETLNIYLSYPDRRIEKLTD